MTVHILSFDNHNVPNDYARDIDQLMTEAYGPDETTDSPQPDAPSEAHRVFLALEPDVGIIGHLAAYIRDTEQNGACLRLGMIGDVATATPFKRRGIAKSLVHAAHEYFQQNLINFSILFAYDPDVYKSSGYRLMENAVRFQEDGAWKTLVYRGSMYCGLSDRTWCPDLIDLKGTAV